MWVHVVCVCAGMWTHSQKCIHTCTLIDTCLGMRCRATAAGTATHRNTLQNIATLATHCITLHHTASHCITLHHTASPCKCMLLYEIRGFVHLLSYHTSVMSHTAWHCHTLQRAMQHIAELCNILQHTATNICLYSCHITRQSCHTHNGTATHCNALQRTATHCNALQRTAPYYNTIPHAATCSNLLQHTVARCNTLWTNFCTLQHTADHISPLWYPTPIMSNTYNAAKSNATHFNTLRHTAPHCNKCMQLFLSYHTPVMSRTQFVLYDTRISWQGPVQEFDLPLQHTATRCNTLQTLQHAANTATHCKHCKHCSTLTVRLTLDNWHTNVSGRDRFGNFICPEHVKHTGERYMVKAPRRGSGVWNKKKCTLINKLVYTLQRNTTHCITVNTSTRGWALRGRDASPRVWRLGKNRHIATRCSTYCNVLDIWALHGRDALPMVWRLKYNICTHLKKNKCKHCNALQDTATHTTKHCNIDCNTLDIASGELGMLSLGQKYLCQEK